jgi:cysteine desulfurase
MFDFVHAGIFVKIRFKRYSYFCIMLKLPIYLDHNATTPCDPRVVEAMLPYFTEKFGNAASRTHSFGWEGEEAVEYAREQVAGLIGAEPKEVIFTSGATEGDNLAIKGVFEMYAGKGNHIITAATEHKAVLDTCGHLEKMGGEVTYLPVNREGLIDLAELEAAIKPTTILIAIMYANNEIGVIQPVREISRIARAHGVLFFTDAAQAVGKVPVDVNGDGIDLMTISAHKLYGPKGVGALYVRRKNPRVRLTAQIDGGGHERGKRSGTLNVPGIVGFGKACELCRLEMEADNGRLARLRDKLENDLLQLELSYINGSREFRLPQTSNISFRYVDAEGLITGVNKNIALSSGSACTSASLEPSYVLKALGLDDELAHSSLRVGLGRFTTDEEVEYAIKELKEAVIRLRGISPQWETYKEGMGQKSINE